MKKILFICKYNRFRSRVALAAFRKLNRNKNIKADSAGIISGSYPIDSLQSREAKKLGLNINGKPKGISTELLKWQDTVIVVANDVPASLFKDQEKYGKRLIVWKIKDETKGNKDNIDSIIKQIIKKVENLVNKGEK